MRFRDERWEKRQAHSALRRVTLAPKQGSFFGLSQVFDSMDRRRGELATCWNCGASDSPYSLLGCLGPGFPLLGWWS